MDEIWIRKDNNFYNDLVECTKVISKKYYEEIKKNKRDFVAHRHTDFRVNKYEKGGFMSSHCDNIHHSHGQKLDIH